MSTQVFLRAANIATCDLWGSGTSTWNPNSALSGVISPAVMATRLQRGGTSTASTATGTSAGNTARIPYTHPSGVGSLVWVTPPLDRDITIASTVTFNIWALESSMNANVQVGCYVFSVDGTQNISAAIADGTEGVELTTSLAVNNFTATPTSTALTRGSRLIIIPYHINIGTEGGGFTTTMNYDGPTSGASGDSFVTFTEDFGFIQTDGISNITEAATGAGAAFGDTGTETRRAFRFRTPYQRTLTSIDIDLNKQGTPTDNVEVALQADSSGVPSGTDLTSASVAGSALTTTQTTFGFDLADTVLSPDTWYWFVIRRSGANDAANFYRWFVGPSGEAEWNAGGTRLWNGTDWSGVNTNIPAGTLYFDEVVYQGNAGGGSQGLQGASGSSELLAQDFKVTSPISLSKVRLLLNKSGTPTDNIVMDIVASLDGTPIETVTVAASSVPASGSAWVDFVFTKDTVLSANTTYYIQLHRSGARDTVNRVNWALSSSSVYADGQGWVKGTGSWAGQSWDFAFRVSDVPGTILFPTNTAGGVDPNGATYDSKEIWTSRGAGVQTAVVNTAAGPTAPLLWTTSAGGNFVEWYSRPLQGFTLAGPVFVNPRAQESGLTANASMWAELAVTDSNGTVLSTWASSTQGGELGTSEGNAALFLSGADLVIGVGQRLRFRFGIDDTSLNGNMASGQTATISFAGASGATGDFYVTLPQGLLEAILSTFVLGARPLLITLDRHNISGPPILREQNNATAQQIITSGTIMARGRGRATAPAKNIVYDGRSFFPYGDAELVATFFGALGGELFPSVASGSAHGGSRIFQKVSTPAAVFSNMDGGVFPLSGGGQPWRFSLYAKYEGANVPTLAWGWQPFTADGAGLYPERWVVGSTEIRTTLTADANVNDTVLNVADSTGFDAANTFAGLNADATGWNDLPLPYTNLALVSSIGTGVINLGQPVQTFAPAGSVVRRMFAGGTFMYIGSLPITTSWTLYSGTTQGRWLPTDTGIDGSKWWWGAAKARIMFLLNYADGTTKTTDVDDIVIHGPPMYGPRGRSTAVGTVIAAPAADPQTIQPAHPLTAGFQRVGPPILQEQSFQAFPPITFVTGQVVGQGHGRAPVRATNIVLGKAVGQGHGRATNKGTDVVIGKAAGRAHGYATNRGTDIEIGRAAGQAHGRSTSRALDLEIGKAAGRGKGRATSTALCIVIAGSPTYTPPTFQTSSVTTSTSTIVKPTGTATGDLLIASIFQVQGGTSPGVPTCTVPSGWTLIQQQGSGWYDNNVLFGENDLLTVIYRVVQAGDTTWPVTMTGPTTADYIVTERWSGQDTTPVGASSAAQSISATGISTTGGGDVVMFIEALTNGWGSDTVTGSFTPPSGYTERIDQSPSSRVITEADAIYNSPSSTGTITPVAIPNIDPNGRGAGAPISVLVELNGVVSGRSTRGNGRGKSTLAGTVIGAEVMPAPARLPLVGALRIGVSGPPVLRTQEGGPISYPTGALIQADPLVGRAHSRATIVGTDIELGKAAGRDHSRATALGTDVVIGKIAGRDHSRATSQTSVLEAGKAVGQAHGRTTSQASSSPPPPVTLDAIIQMPTVRTAGFSRIGPPILAEQRSEVVQLTQGTAAGEGHGRATVTAQVIVRGAAQGREHTRAAALATNIVRGLTVGRDHARATSQALVLVRGLTVGRNHAKATSLASVFVLGQIAGKAHSLATSLATSFTMTVEAITQMAAVRAAGFKRIGPPILREQELIPPSLVTFVTGQAIARGKGRTQVTAQVVVTGKAAGRTHSKATAQGTNVLRATAVARNHSRATARAVNVLRGSTIARAHARAATRGLTVSTGQAVSYGHGRATSRALGLVTCRATGRAHSRTTLVQVRPEAILYESIVGSGIYDSTVFIHDTDTDSGTEETSV